MGDAVARVRADVEHEARTALCQAVPGGDATGDVEHLDEEIPMVGGDVRGVDDVLSRNDKDVGGRHGVQVPERIDEIGRDHLGRGELTCGDGAEEAVSHEQERNGGVLRVSCLRRSGPGG